MDIPEYLIKQIVYIDENKKDFLDLYFPYTDQFSTERRKMEAFLSRYISYIEEKLQKNNKIDKLDFVTIGSNVTLFYIDDRLKETFTICFPHESDPDESKISFLSPVGQQLLLAEIDQTLKLNTPVGAMDVQVSEINLELIEK